MRVQIECNGKKVYTLVSCSLIDTDDYIGLMCGVVEGDVREQVHGYTRQGKKEESLERSTSLEYRQQVPKLFEACGRINLRIDKTLFKYL